MVSFTKIYLTALTADEAGTTLVEYGIAVTLAVVVGTVGLLALAGAINGNIDGAIAEM